MHSRPRRHPLLFTLLVLLAACAPGAAPASPTVTPVQPGATAAPATAIATPAPPAMPPTVATAARGTGTPGATATRTASPAATGCGPGVDFLGFSDALDKTTFGGTDVGGLSALAYDAARGVTYALVDNEGETPARLYTLRLPLDGGALGTPQVLAVTILRRADGQPFTGRDFDGEGLALLPDGSFLISSETEPSIRHFAADGGLLDELPVPPRFLVKPAGEATVNLTFEGLALAPGGASLYAGEEGPLAPDSFTLDLRARLRLLRYNRGPDGALRPAAQHFYLAEPAQGVADLAALGPTDLLVLERGFISGRGNTIRLFRTDVAGAADVTDRPALTAAGLTPLPKTLVADLATCPPGGVRAAGPQANPLLDNIEGLTLGPVLPDGRQVLLLVSDDNFGRDQITRIYALALRP